MLIHQALSRDPVDVESLQAAALGQGGLLTDEIRRKVWPKLLGVNAYSLPPKPGTVSLGGGGAAHLVLTFPEKEERPAWN